jgi:hypothetical protein
MCLVDPHQHLHLPCNLIPKPHVNPTYQEVDVDEAS